MTLTEYEKILAAYCYQCGADWSDWIILGDKQREAILDNNPDANLDNLNEGLCPVCRSEY